MSDDKPRPESHDETQPVRPAAALPEPPAAAPGTSGTSAPTGAATEPPASEPPAAGPPAQRRGFRERLRTWRGSRAGDRTYGLAALIASALAGIIVGGLGVATFQAVTDDHDRDRDGWVQRDDDRGPGDGGGMRGGPRGVPGQLPPTTGPEDEDSSAS